MKHLMNVLNLSICHLKHGFEQIPVLILLRIQSHQSSESLLIVFEGLLDSLIDSFANHLSTKNIFFHIHKVNQRLQYL